MVSTGSGSDGGGGPPPGRDAGTSAMPEMRSAMVGSWSGTHGCRDMEVGTQAIERRDRSTSPDFMTVDGYGGGPPPPPSYGAELSRRLGYSSTSTWFHDPVEFGLPPPRPPDDRPDAARQPHYTGRPLPPPLDPPQAVFVNPHGRPPPPPPGAAAAVAGFVPEPMIMDVEQPTIVHVHYPHHDPPHTDEPRYRLRLRRAGPEGADAHPHTSTPRSLRRPQSSFASRSATLALAEVRLRATRELARQMAPPVPSVADQLATIPNGQPDGAHGQDPGRSAGERRYWRRAWPAPAPARPGRRSGNGTAPLAAPPIFAGAASSSAAPGVSSTPPAERRATPDDLPAKIQRVGTPSPERRAKEARQGGGRQGRGGHRSAAQGGEGGSAGSGGRGPSRGAREGERAEGSEEDEGGGGASAACRVRGEEGKG
jgi:hypothetical protein